MSKLAIVFAGQGAQAVGMGKDLYSNFESARKIYDLCPEIRDIAFNGPKEDLDITINTQPAVFLTDLACAAVLTEKGIKADGVAGFSLGEVAAVSYAGLMTTEQAFEFVRNRAKAMQTCTEKNKGGMCAVLKLEVNAVEEICKKIPKTYPVNYNAPGQVVVAYDKSSEEELEKAIADAGGRCMKLAVSGAFHSPLMNEASEAMEKYLSNIEMAEPIMPVYSNLTAQVYTNPKEQLAKQINSPVLWQQTIENMIKDGYDTFIEAGPGKTLTGLIKKINPSVKTQI
ncbi:MAG: ACP S-malonyltransferase [Oscillospiraceae bacterium]|nr:ACP S-malonyltransferase [Oscillospiraceae bacterium]